MKVKTVTKELEALKKKRPSPDSFDDLDRALQEEMNNQVAKVGISKKIYHRFSRSEPVFVNLLRDSQPGGTDSSESIPGLGLRVQIKDTIQDYEQGSGMLIWILIVILYLYLRYKFSR